MSSDEPISVLIALPPSTDPSSLKGLLHVFSQTLNSKNEQVFTYQTCGPDEVHKSVLDSLPSGISHTLPTPVMTLTEASTDPLEDFDILIVPHLTSEPPQSPGQAEPQFFGHSRRKSYNNADTVAFAPDDELAALIAHWATVQKENATRERSLLTIGTGTLSAARAGALRRLAASIHPSLLTRLELECQAATLAHDPEEERTMVVDQTVDPVGGWYVVSNGRFDIDDIQGASKMQAAAGDASDEAVDVVDDELPSPRLGSKKAGSFSNKGSKAIPGSVGRRFSKRRESISRRQSLPLCGLRVITASESAAATDSALYLVAAMHSLDRAQEIAGMMNHDWRKGMTVGAVDV